jgi:hypothetical protein
VGRFASLCGMVCPSVEGLRKVFKKQITGGCGPISVGRFALSCGMVCPSADGVAKDLKADSKTVGA